MFCDEAMVRWFASWRAAVEAVCLGFSTREMSD